MHQNEHHSEEVDLIISNAELFDGSGGPSVYQDIAIKGDSIVAMGALADVNSKQTIDAKGLALAPGFIDVHTHDDIELLRNPDMLSKISQGVTTVITGNCGISASPYPPTKHLPDPINLLGAPEEFVFPRFANYIHAVQETTPATNVAALVGHTSLRAQVMEDLSAAATPEQITAMADLLQSALNDGAIGFSTGLAYANAKGAPTSEVDALVGLVSKHDAVYTTHLRTEFDGIIGAMDEAFAVGRNHKVPVIISHLKCAGKANWGRSKEILEHFKNASVKQKVGYDCYPYHASSSTLDLKQVTDDFDIDITWSVPHPEMSGKRLADIAKEWQLSLLDAAKKLKPAGAVYHGMDQQDVENFVRDPEGMVGSDGLPCDPMPHPRLWGSFPRVLAHYVRDKKVLTLPLAIHKMTGLSAGQFKLSGRGLLKPGYKADLVLFDPLKVEDKATFKNPKQLSAGIEKVWVNGTLTLEVKGQQPALTGKRAGTYLKPQHV